MLKDIWLQSPKKCQDSKCLASLSTTRIFADVIRAQADLQEHHHPGSRELYFDCIEILNI